MLTDMSFKLLKIKYLLFILLWITLPGKTWAQEIEVNTANGTVGPKSLKGFVVCLELDAKMVEKGWSRYLKSLGKFETVDNQAMAGLGLMVTAISGDAIDFYSKITVSPRCVQVFMGALRAGSNMELLDVQAENVKRMLYDFAVEQYRQDLIGQISEAERVVNLAVKAHDKRISESNSLKNKMARNRQERSKLLRHLDENATHLVKLKSDSTRNATDLEAALEEINKVRKIAEEKKTKLNQVK